MGELLQPCSVLFVGAQEDDRLGLGVIVLAGRLVLLESVLGEKVSFEEGAKRSFCRRFSGGLQQGVHVDCQLFDFLGLDFCGNHCPGLARLLGGEPFFRAETDSEHVPALDV